jgi:serine/threonine protein kinase
MGAKTSQIKSLFPEEAEEIFCVAMELGDASERIAYVKNACAGNKDLEAKVEELVSMQDEVESFFKNSKPVVEFPNAEQEPLAAGRNGGGPTNLKEISHEELGTRIGPYRLLQIIGEGGCGTVYMAEQEKPVRRRIALKIIKLGMDTKNIIARFSAERQALALMDHPNIARVLDAGATETGRPYFVMELVRGIKLTTYCDQKQLDTRQRLKLFIQICHAVGHAHQKGVIHRDLKPSNILVTMHDGSPIPVVIDFGIAKAFEGRLTDQTLFTAYEQLIGTPAYMSPEQAEMSRMDVDTRSDIYSLGVLLYELLTGRTPFNTTQLLQSGVDEMRRTLRERDPLKPSSILTTLRAEELTQTAHHRYVEPVKLVSMLRGDLDWIAMKALEKNRNRRYQTANALAMEVQRYLDNEPILARPPSRVYRLQKLIARNKFWFASGTAFIAALAIGLGVSTALLIRTRAAEREEARLRKVAETGFLTEEELRRQAEVREKIIEASALIDKGSYAEADQIASQIPLEPSTMEGVDVFQTLGDWDAAHELWPAAKDRFHQLLHVNGLKKSTDTSLDWTKEAVAMISSNDRKDYTGFSRNDIRAFKDTDDPVVAGRALRNCLLMPPSQDLVNLLKPLAQCAQKPLEDKSFPANIANWQIPWRCQVLSLWEYRIGNLSEAIVWGHRCLDFEKSPPACLACAESVLAMSLQRQGKTDEAQSELAAAQKMIETKFAKPMALNDSSDGSWYDWVAGRILFQEATAFIKDSPPASDQKLRSDIPTTDRIK